MYHIRPQGVEGEINSVCLHPEQGLWVSATAGNSWSAFLYQAVRYKNVGPTVPALFLSTASSLLPCPAYISLNFCYKTFHIFKKV